MHQTKFNHFRPRFSYPESSVALDFIWRARVGIAVSSVTRQSALSPEKFLEVESEGTYLYDAKRLALSSSIFCIALGVVVPPYTMGIKGLKKLVPVTKLKEFASSFDPATTFRIDAANLMFVAAHRHATTFNEGDYNPAVCQFMLQIQFYKARGMRMLILFDGKDDPDKRHENARRAAKRAVAQANIKAAAEKGETPASKDVAGLVKNTALYIACCAKVCQFLGVPYVVCPFQADAMLRGLPRDTPWVTVTSDTDALPYSVDRLVSIIHSSYFDRFSPFFRAPLKGEINTNTSKHNRGNLKVGT